MSLSTAHLRLGQLQPFGHAADHPRERPTLRLEAGANFAGTSPALLRAYQHDALASALADYEKAMEYSLGLLVAETGRMEEAAALLARAAAGMPSYARAAYNAGLALGRDHPPLFWYGGIMV